MTELVWEDPPAASLAPRRSVWRATISELEANPGRWARILERGDDVERQRVRKALYRYGCQVCQRVHEDGSVSVWARVPDQDPG